MKTRLVCKVILITLSWIKNSLLTYKYKKGHKLFFKNQISVYLFKSTDIVSYGLLQMSQCIVGNVMAEELCLHLISI